MWQRVLRCFRRDPIIMDVLAGLAFALNVNFASLCRRSNYQGAAHYVRRMLSSLARILH